MTTKDDGGPAFPSTTTDLAFATTEIRWPLYGMSLRDWFAGQALTGVIRDVRAEMQAMGEWTDLGEPDTDGALLIAEQCYAMADAMLAERAKGVS